MVREKLQRNRRICVQSDGSVVNGPRDRPQDINAVALVTVTILGTGYLRLLFKVASISFFDSGYWLRFWKRRRRIQGVVQKSSFWVTPASTGCPLTSSGIY